MKGYQGLKSVVLSVVMVMGVLLGLWADCALATGNLLLNPGEEDGINNWDAHGSSFSYRNTGTDKHYARNGSRFFYGGDDNDRSRASQYIDVSGYAEAIDDGQVWASLDGYLMGCGDDDKGRLDLLFWEGGTEYTTGWRGLEDDNWCHYAPEVSNKLLSSGTRKVEVRMQADRKQGIMNDAYTLMTFA
ncbi:MAG: hypothetical protein ABIJ30_11185 [bacterium]